MRIVYLIGIMFLLISCSNSDPFNMILNNEDSVFKSIECENLDNINLTFNFPDSPVNFTDQSICLVRVALFNQIENSLSKGKSICNKIKDSTQKNECKSILDGNNNPPQLILQLIYTGHAFSFARPHYCYALLNLSQYPRYFNSCYINSIYNSNNVNLCDIMIEDMPVGFSYDNQYYNCIYYFAEKNQDLTVCKRLNQTWLSDACIIGLAQTRFTLNQSEVSRSFCEHIIDAPGRAECFNMASGNSDFWNKAKKDYESNQKRHEEYMKSISRQS